MASCDSSEKYLMEDDVSDFKMYPFFMPRSLKLFLESPTSVYDGKFNGKRRRPLDHPHIQAKYLCQQLLEEINNEIDLADDGMHPKICYKERRLNSEWRCKLNFERNVYESEVRRLKDEHDTEIKLLTDELEKRKDSIVTEMLTQLEKQKEIIGLKLKNCNKGVKNGNNMSVCGNSVDSLTSNQNQVVTRTLRKRANAEAANAGSIISTSSTPDVCQSFVNNSQSSFHNVSLLCKAVDINIHRDLTASMTASSINEIIKIDEDGLDMDRYEEIPRIKGAGNSIALTANGFRADSLLATLEVKLSDNEISNDLLLATKGKYKVSQSTGGQSGNSSNGVCTNFQINVDQNDPISHPSSPNSNKPCTTVFVEDKSLVYNSMTFCKGQQVYIEGPTRATCLILGINQTEIQLKKLNDSTKIKLSLDMLRRATYKLTPK